MQSVLVGAFIYDVYMVRGRFICEEGNYITLYGVGVGVSMDADFEYLPCVGL